MKDFHLRFHVEEWPSGSLDLLTADERDLPDESGAYVLGASGDTAMIYPWGTSPIYYIGKADSLRDRLIQHRRHIEGAAANYWERWWWPRYQYGAAFGASCSWFLAGDREPSALEAILVTEFYQHYGSIPVTNRVWPRVPDQD